VRRTSSKEKRLVRRSSSKKDKENGNEHKAQQHSSAGAGGYQVSPTSAATSDANQLVGAQTPMCSESEPTDCDVQPMNTSLTYKPRI